MKQQIKLLTLLIGTVFLTGCYTELAVLNTSEPGYTSKARDFTNSDTEYNRLSAVRDYTTNPNAENIYYEDEQAVGVFVDYDNVPASGYMGVNPDISNRELAELIVDSRDNTRNLACDPLYFDEFNCQDQFLFQTGNRFNRFGMFNQFNRFGMGGMAFGNSFYDPFWGNNMWWNFGPGFGFFNDPFHSPFAFNGMGFGGFGFSPFGWGNNWGGGNNGVFVPVDNNNNNLANNGRNARGSSVGRAFVRDRSDARGNAKIDNSSVRSARTTAATSSIAGMRNSYTTTTGVSRAARTPSTSRISTTNRSYTRPSSASTYNNTTTRRRYFPSNAAASTARSSSTYNSNTSRSSYSRTNNRSYRTNSSSYSTPRSSNVGSRTRSSSSSSVGRSSSGSTSRGSSSRGSTTTRGKRGNN
jgi:hypothetical protein